MPPHCDAIDGPVVRTALRALEENDVTIVLPYVGKDSEAEVIRAFARVMPLRSNGATAREVGELHFFETVVRLHRQGEGEAYTGLKAAGLDVGPVIPVAERSIESGSVDELVRLLTSMVEHATRERHARVMALKPRDGASVDEVREYVEAMLGLQVWSHKLHGAVHADPHQHKPVAAAGHAH